MSDFSSRRDGPIERPHLPVRKVFEAYRGQSDETVVPEGIEWPMVDGKPVVPGDVLYDKDGKYRMVGLVSFTFMKDEPIVEMTDGTDWYFPEAFELLTRTNPPKTLLDHDGVAIEVGDTVYMAVKSDKLYGDEPLEVIDVHTDGYHSVEVRKRNGFIVGYDPNHLTHKRPLETADDNLIELTAKRDPKPEWLHAERLDSWGRLEEDAVKTCCGYYGRSGPCEDCPGYDLDEKKCVGSERVSLDIVRRAKALAGVDE